MKRILGIVAGLGILTLSFLAWRHASAAGWALERSDIGLWWSIIGTLLGISGSAAVIGTLIHSRA